MINCRRATQLMSEAQERELTFSERASLKTHTLMCAACRNASQQMDSLRRIARAYARGIVGSDAESSPGEGKGKSGEN